VNQRVAVRAPRIFFLLKNISIVIDGYILIKKYVRCNIKKKNSTNVKNKKIKNAGECSGSLGQLQLVA
jgi:hypothetical protein